LTAKTEGFESTAEAVGCGEHVWVIYSSDSENSPFSERGALTYLNYANCPYAMNISIFTFIIVHVDCVSKPC